MRTLVIMCAMVICATVGYGAIIIVEDSVAGGWNADPITQDPLVANGLDGAATTDAMPGLGDSDVYGFGLTGVEFNGDDDLGIATDFIYENVQLVNPDGANELEFTFYNQDSASYVPNQLWAFMWDDANDYEWLYDLTPLLTATAQQTFTVQLGSTSWYDLGSAGLGNLNLNSIAGMGIVIQYDTSYVGNQAYGIGGYKAQFNPPVPEPGSFIVLSTALMSLGFTYARRKKEKKLA